ncbi:MAG TPA: hypothetical protein VGO40_20100 [Longimicrobium sp.]|jgi:hypothetical protein|nr:hypothetical protein [Longimicrobium sp.]
MPVIGPIVRPTLAHLRARKIIGRLDQAIAEREGLRTAPLLDGMAGTARYDAASTLLEATLYARTGSAPAGERGRLREQYHRRREEEYWMANEDLRKEAATRAEVAALGLAVKEVAVSLDSEIEQFRGSAATLVGETQGALTRLRLESLQIVRSETERLDTRLSEGASAVQAGVDRAVAELRGQLAVQHDFQRRQNAELLAAQEALRAALVRSIGKLRLGLYTVLALAAVATVLAAAGL